MDGFEATRRIRQFEQEQGLAPVPIFALTSNTLLANKEKCLQVGMTDFLAKPVTRATLIKALEKVPNFLTKYQIALGRARPRPQPKRTNQLVSNLLLPLTGRSLQKPR